jgi:hypothetical protein
MRTLALSIGKCCLPSYRRSASPLAPSTARRSFRRRSTCALSFPPIPLPRPASPGPCPRPPYLSCNDEYPCAILDGRHYVHHVGEHASKTHAGQRRCFPPTLRQRPEGQVPAAGAASVAAYPSPSRPLARTRRRQRPEGRPLARTRRRQRPEGRPLARTRQAPAGPRVSLSSSQSNPGLSAMLRATSSTAPSATVVICTRDRAAVLDACLQAVARLRYPHFQVLIVENGPPDGRTQSVAQRHGALYLSSPRASASAGRAMMAPGPAPPS